jgi:single-strand selective monofunctional uracil DNA glycosylase
VEAVYNPLAYAWRPHRLYLERHGARRSRILLLGMNPGPWGMAQTGVPFGDVSMVRDWLGIQGAVGKPDSEHPRRPVEGFECGRREVSGRRLWGWARDRFETPDRFLGRFFVHNYCPLCFLEEGGRNRTPDRLPAHERDQLLAVCDDALRDLVEVLAPERVVGVGRFAETRARAALSEDVRVDYLPHPSPARPQSGAWADAADEAFRQMGVELE